MATTDEALAEYQAAWLAYRGQRSVNGAARLCVPRSVVSASAASPGC